MVTKTRKKERIAREDSDIIAILFDGKEFNIHKHTEIYKEYLQRKDLGIDFSSINSEQDIQKAYSALLEKYKDYPTLEQLKYEKKDYDLLYKTAHDETRIYLLTKTIVFHLRHAIDTMHVSDKEYEQVIKYIKGVIKSYLEKTSLKTKITQFVATDKISVFYKDYVKKTIKESLSFYNGPKELLQTLIDKLPASMGKEDEDKFTSFFYKRLRAADNKLNKRYNELRILVAKYKIKTDALRTFETQLKQHRDKAHKTAYLSATKSLEEMARQEHFKKNHLRGLATQHLAHMHEKGDR